MWLGGCRTPCQSWPLVLGEGSLLGSIEPQCPRECGGLLLGVRAKSTAQSAFAEAGLRDALIVPCNKLTHAGGTRASKCCSLCLYLLFLF